MMLPVGVVFVVNRAVSSIAPELRNQLASGSLYSSEAKLSFVCCWKPFVLSRAKVTGSEGLEECDADVDSLFVLETVEIGVLMELEGG